MAHTITGKLNKPAREFQAGESTGFSVGLGVQYYDRQAKQKAWTDYKAAVFTKNPQQIDFYRQSLVPGSIVSVSGKNQKIDSFDGQNGTVYMIELLDASIDFVHTAESVHHHTSRHQSPQQAPQQYQQPAPQQQYQQSPPAHQPQPQAQMQQQPAPMQQHSQGGDFDSDIPFMRIGKEGFA